MMPGIEDLVPKPPRPPHPAWSARAVARLMKSLWVAVGFLVLGLALVAVQFTVEDAAIYPRVAIGVFTLPMFVMCWLMWRSGSRAYRETMQAWETWPVAGMKSEGGGAPRPVDPATLDLKGILAGRSKDAIVLVDPKYRFNRKALEPEFLQELSEKASGS